MCNPNSSIANRRFRALSASNALRKNLGTVVGGQATKTACGRLTQNLMAGTTTSLSVEDAATPTVSVSAPYHKSEDTQQQYYPSSSTYYVDGAPYAPSPSSYQQHYYQPPPPQQPTQAHYLPVSRSIHDQHDHQVHDPFHVQASQVQAPATVVAPKKVKPKRRRKPQKPGLTAKNQERHFVHHNYHDHAEDQEQDIDGDSSDADHSSRRRGGVSVSFPLRLHSVLERIEEDGYGHICCWQPHGRCFLIHKPQEFTDTVLPNYFRQTKLTSFQRQLNLYGYQRITRGPDAGSYYHELFLRGKSFLCKRMQRTKVKGTKFKAASNPDEEPNFCKMKPVPASSSFTLAAPAQVSDTSDHSDEDGSNHGDTHASSFEPPHGNGLYGASASYYGQYASHLSDASMSTTARPRSDSFSYSQAPLSPMNSLAAATFGIGSPLSPVRPQVAVSQSNHMMPLPASSSLSRTDGCKLSPVETAAAAIFPSPSAGGDDMLDSIVNDLFFDDAAQGTDGKNQQNQALDEETIDFVNSFDPVLSTVLGSVKNNDISDFELGSLLDKMLDQS
mmetsp:Transcript_10763/g.25649  ORF Transcript_10763/g.25649 Transcript_10763/m.25649 type:complete len:558 (+) Transcript_10763:284-1957(+)